MSIDAATAVRAATMVAAAALLAGCGVPEEAPTASPPASWDRFADEFIEAYFDVLPTSGVWAGRHEYDGRLPEVSATGIARRVSVLRDFAARAEREFPADSLAPEEDLQKRQLIAALDGMLFWVEDAESHRRDPAWYAGAISPSVYVSREYAPEAVRLQAITAYLQELPAYLEQMRATLEPPFPRPFVRTAIVRFGGLATHLEQDVPVVFAEVEDEALQRAFANALARPSRRCGTSRPGWNSGCRTASTTSPSARSGTGNCSGACIASIWTGGRSRPWPKPTWTAISS